MKKAVVILVGIVLLVLVGGAIFLATAPVPAPSGKIEKPVADDKMPK